MTMKSILRDANFEEVAEVKPDAKHRIVLRKAVGLAKFYRVYRNPLGQIILDPQATIPAHEAWLFKNAEATAMVQRGLHDAKRRRLVKAKEDYSKYLHED